MNEHQERQRKLVERMLAVRKLERHGATEGERAAAASALERLAASFYAAEAVPVESVERVRARLDGMQQMIDSPPPPPRPVFRWHPGHVVIIGGGRGQLTTFTGSSATCTTT